MNLSRAILLAVTLLAAGCARGDRGEGKPVAPARPEAANAATVSMWRSQYEQHKEQWRTTFQGADSPLPEAARAGASGPSFYPYAPEWRLVGDLVRLKGAEQKFVKIPTTRGKTQDYLEYGRIPVAAGGDTVALLVYRPLEHPEQFFIPFRDKSNGDETYGGGRYVHLDSLDTHRFILDFNGAYNPYCAYDTSWICPLPPPGNTLPFAVRAGMLAPKDHP
jgi:uncharacterized protein (DUF1684 family)